MMTEFLTPKEPDLFECVLQELSYTSTPDPELVNSTILTIAEGIVHQSDPFSEDDGRFAAELVSALFASDRRGYAGTDKLAEWLAVKVTELSSGKMSVRKLDRTEARGMMSYSLKTASALYLEVITDGQKPILVEISDTVPPVSIIKTA